MKRLFISSVLVLSTLFGSGVAFAFENTFLQSDAIPADIQSVHMELFDMARTDLGCSYDVCFRMEIFLNGQLVARWGSSPGDPNNDVGFNGVNTPKYNNRSLNRARIMGADYVSSRGDSMPYAMFILGSKGQNTGFAVHAGNVTGEKESHGCVRLEYDNAKMLNSWVREAIKNKGATTISSQHTTD